MKQKRTTGKHGEPRGITGKHGESRGSTEKQKKRQKKITGNHGGIAADIKKVTFDKTLYISVTKTSNLSFLIKNDSILTEKIKKLSKKGFNLPVLPLGGIR